MKTLHITEIGKIDQDGLVNSSELQVVEGDCPEDMVVIRNDITVAHVDRESGQLHVMFLRDEDSPMGMIVETDFATLPEEEKELDIVSVTEMVVSNWLREVSEELESEQVTSLFKDLTIKEGPDEYFLHTVVYMDSREDLDAVVIHMAKSADEARVVTFDVGRIIETFNISKTAEELKKHLRESMQPTHKTDLQLEYLLAITCQSLISLVKYPDIAKAQFEKELLVNDVVVDDLEEEETLEDGQV